MYETEIQIIYNLNAPKSINSATDNTFMQLLVKKEATQPAVAQKNTSMSALIKWPQRYPPCRQSSALQPPVSGEHLLHRGWLVGWRNCITRAQTQAPIFLFTHKYIRLQARISTSDCLHRDVHVCKLLATTMRICNYLSAFKTRARRRALLQFL